MLLWKVAWLDAPPRFSSFNPCSLGCCSERAYPDSGRTYASSFNPCSLGCCSERIVVLCFHWLPLEFQSLFSWMLLWKDYASDSIIYMYIVSILVLLDVALKDRRTCLQGVYRNLFQSLFSWMLLWKTDQDYGHGDGVRFQSLFSWMLLWKAAGAISFFDQ